MELKCPKCGEPILPNDSNPATDLAWCRKCGEGFSCRELIAAASAAASAAGTVDLPENFTLLKKDDAETLRRSPGHALFYLGLMFLLAALCAGGLFMNRTAAHQKYYMAVFGAVVALFSVLQIPVSLAGVTVDRKARTLTGGGLFKLRTASFDEIEEIQSAASSSKPKSWFVGVILKDGSSYALFGDLYAEDAQKLEDFLTQRIFS